MKTIMKNIIGKSLLGVSLCALLASSTGCTKLDETLYDTLSDQNIDLSNPTDRDLLQGQAITQYKYLHESWFGLFHMLALTDEYCIPLRIGMGWGDLYILGHKHTWNADYGMIENNWNYAYNCINYCNKVLDAMSEEEIEKYGQEARFFRATTYYHLLDLFRNVPLQTTAMVEKGYVPDQASAQQVYDFCVSELNAIKETITTDKNFGHPNKYAVCMTLAKLYLNKNVYLGTNDNAGYEAALKEVETVITEGGYSLAPKYSDNFRENIDACPEVIFAIPGDRTHSNIFNAHTYFMPLVGLQAYGSTANATNGSNAVPQFVDTYDPDDKRLNDTWANGLQHFAVENPDGTYTPNAGDPIPYDEDDWSQTGYLTYNRNVHSIDGAYKQEGYRLHKYEIIGGKDNGTSCDDLVIFRLADAMFIKAECLLRLGRDEQTAADLVTQVRRRSFESEAKATRTVAQLKGGSVYKYGHEECISEGYANWSDWKRTYEGGDDIILGGLLDDLGWEFCCEEHRRQDLIRFRMTDGRNVWNGKSWFCKDATDQTHWDYFPIPTVALRTNNKLKQNQGY